MSKSKKAVKKTTILLIILGLLGVVGVIRQKSYSASLTTVSVTLSNSRLSFRGALETGNTVGSTQVTIDTTGYPSTSTEQVVEGDVLAIGNSSSLGTYTVASTSSLTVIDITSGLLAGDSEAGDDIISTASATHTVRFTTASALTNGRFRILVPALDNDAASSDGIPDGGQFDFGSTAPTVTCPADITGYDFVTGTASASAITLSGRDYHAFECAYSGAGATSSPFDGTTNDAIVINSLINPAPKSGHTTGTADAYQVIIQHFNSSFTVVDQTAVGIGVIEAVKVTALVPSQITFAIAGVASGVSSCGVNTDVATSTSSVPFGELIVGSFKDAAQTLTISTNAVNGYSVTAVANDQLGRNGGTCLGDNTGSNCIRDSAGDTTTMTHSVSDEWTSTGNKGFAYSIHNADASSVPFQYTSTTGGCSGTFCARQFADAEDSQGAVQVFNSSTVADSENINICYRIVVSATTAAGDYENFVTYTATSTF